MGLQCLEKVPWPQSEVFPEKMSCGGRLRRLDRCVERKKKNGIRGDFVHSVYTQPGVLFLPDMISCLSGAVKPCAVRRVQSDMMARFTSRT